jgi:ATP-dependent helicase/nuclease subunit A
MVARCSTGVTPAPDQEQRDLILTELDRNILVEAAAGTGKTTGMVGRMLALLRTGKCGNIRTMAAVTFTRKAAAELRARFQVELERAVREAEGEEKDNLERAHAHAEQCFIGTIHSFCARLLRERPVEAGVDLAFEEIDDVADRRLREEAWDEFTARLIADDPDDLLGELQRLGLKLSELKGAFIDFADFPDVDEWPVPDLEGEPEGLDRVLNELESYVAHLAELAPMLPEAYGTDTLIPECRRLPRIISHYPDRRRPDQLMEVMGRFDRNVKATQYIWEKGDGLTKADAKAEQARWEKFREEVARPCLRAWREIRYGTVMRLLFKAREVYDDLRRERGRLNFQDLLIKAAGLLRENPNVRRYFQNRFSHLLVDEFQDTDPIQAEVILLLASTDPGEADWRRCVPRPGSLFVVGDPKQSIYRFRRADIVTYNEVKEIIERGGEGREGLVIRLSSNFRAAQPIIDWVNRVFEPGEPDAVGAGKAMLRFPGEDSEESPSYVPLFKGREEGKAGEFSGLFWLSIPEEFTRKEQAVDYEADLIARLIRRALDLKMTVPLTRRQIEEGRTGEVDPSDFMIITRNTTNLGVYARKLQEYDIPHQVTGGAALNEVGELKLLHACLRAAVHPDDPVSLVAALRSELFGLSDASLYAYKKAGGVFSYNAAIPGGLPPEEAEAFGDAFNRLRTYSLWLSRIPPAAAFERIAADLGLPALAAARPGGDVEAGSLAKALELLRGAQPEKWTAAELVEYLGRLVEGEERHDGVSARSGERPAVRVMNLHKVKGLEAPVVFLADPSGESEHDIDRHIDRSGDRVLGYIAVYGETKGFNRGKPLAHPAGWESLSEREKEFLKAEGLRLRYVSATRSGAATIITQRAKGNRYNPWRHFAGHLPEDAALPDPGPQAAPEKEREAITAREAIEAAGSIASRLAGAREPTYDARGAKEYALALPAKAGPPRDEEPVPAASTAPAPYGEGEHGVEWGGVIHLLLQAAMENPGTDLERLAAAALAENDLDAGLAEAAADTARSVMQSGIWRRALQSPRRLAEVPFQVLREEGTRVPTILRGVIDLIFLGDGGWVLVDYKTDILKGKKPHLLLEKYRPQVEIYAEAWKRCTGEPVKEAFLYFLQADLLLPLPGE